MKVTRMVNIGPGLQRLLAEIDINTAEEFLKRDPEELYLLIEKNHPKLHLAVLASFVGAHSETAWYYIYPEIKKDFLSRNR